MKKLSAAAVLALSAMVMTEASASTVSLGYAQMHLSENGYGLNVPGVELKYLGEEDKALGVMTTLAYGKKNFAHGTKFSYTQFAVGPSWRFNEYLAAYVVGGFTYASIKIDNALVKLDRHSTNFNYGAGLQVNPYSNLAFDFSYQFTRVPDGASTINAGSWVVGVGWRF